MHVLLGIGEQRVLRYDDFAAYYRRVRAGFEAAIAASAATEPYPPVTDDSPIQEYAGAAQLVDHRLLTSLFDPSRASTWCPACVVDGRPRPGLEGLPRHLALLAGIYRDPSFYRYAAPPSQAPRVFRVALDPAVARAALAESVYLQRVFTGPDGHR